MDRGSLRRAFEAGLNRRSRFEARHDGEAVPLRLDDGASQIPFRVMRPFRADLGS